MGLEVTTESGERPSWNAAAIRNLMRIVDVLLIGPILIATSERRQRLGDRLADTVVIQKRREEPAPRAGPPPAVAPQPAQAPPSVAATGVEPSPVPEPPEPPADITPPADTTPPPGDGVGIAPGGWGPMQVLLAVGVAIVLLFVGTGIVAAFDPDLESTAATLAAQAVLAAVLAGVAIAFAMRHGSGNPLVMLGLRPCKWSALGVGLAAFGGYIVFAAIYAPLVQPEQEDVTRELGFDEGGLAAVIAGLLIIGAAPLSEEIFFRGFMFAGLRRRLPLWPAAAIAGIVFGAVHYTGPDSIGVVPQLAVFGMLLAWLYEYTGSLWPPVLVHTLNNTIAFVVVTST
jgi:membrane protease YdiL (CAAX protease family)